MTIATLDKEPPAGLADRLRIVPLWVWWLVAVAAMTALALMAKGPGRTFEFIDSDDALRFIHVRDLLAGASWFEIKSSALGGAEGLVSHWSRLIDGPMALLMALLRIVLPEAQALQALVVVWPLLLLGAMLWSIARTTLAATDRATAHIALALGALSLLGYYQFAPGRLDHHNVMIAATVSAALLMWAYPQSLQVWRWAGALCALALAIGYEALAPVFVLAALAVGWGLIDRRMAPQAGVFVIGLAAMLVVALGLTVAPSRWLAVTCDALGLNLVALAVCGAAGFVLVMRKGDAWSWPCRIAVLATGGGVGLALFGWLEPACLAGPMGQVPPALHTIWMGQVDEAQSLLMELARGKIATALVPVVIFAVGLVVLAFGVGRSARPADRFLVAASVAFVALALWQMKFIAYASFILVPAFAVIIARLPALGEIRAAVVRVVAICLLNQLVLFSLALSLKEAIVPAEAGSSAVPGAAAAVQGCTAADALRALAQLPPGLVVSHNDIGAHLAVYTSHRALSGPYHRIPAAIIANHEILSATEPASAGRRLAHTGADYLLGCRPLDQAQLAKPGWQTSMLADLAAERPPAFLVPIPLDGAPLFRMWRVDRSRLPAP